MSEETYWIWLKNHLKESPKSIYKTIKGTLTNIKSILTDTFLETVVGGIISIISFFALLSSSVSLINKILFGILGLPLGFFLITHAMYRDEKDC